MDADKKQDAESSCPNPDALHRLRQQADAQMLPAESHVDEMTDLQLKNMIYELQVHQLELSIQNEELRDTQLKLAETRDQYLALYDQAPVAYLTLWDSGRISACNLATARLLGVSRNALIGRRLQEFITQERQNEFHLHWQHLLQSQKPQVVELMVKSPQGQTWVRMESHIEVSDAVCSKAKWHTALTDISEQKQLQQNLAHLNRELGQRVAIRTRKYEESRQELDAILNAVADAVVTFDGTGRIEHVNRAAERLLEFGPGSLIGVNIGQLIHQSIQSGQEDFINAFLQHAAAMKDPVLRTETVARTQRGNLIPVDFSLTQVEYQNRFTAVLRDIRDIKSLQRDVLKTTEEERSRISRDLHDSIGQELVGMSMLAKSMAAAHAADDTVPDEVAENCLRFSRMLDTSVGELRQIIFDLAPLELADGGLVEALQNLAAVVNRDNDVECRLTFTQIQTGTGQEVNIQLLRLAREAVHNAVKHARARHIDIRLEGEDEIRLIVEDDGCGMPDQDVVDPKSQGIRIMQYRANLMGGRLTVEPNSPRGTRVICRLARAI